MEQKMYSEGLSVLTEELFNRKLVESLNNLKSFLRVNELKILNWDEDFVAVPLKIQVILPPLGNYESIDIREVEPILLVINKKHYPEIPPQVYTDRVSFPKDRLAHLFVAKNGKPPAICLVRGAMDEWYADKRLKDVIIRTENWLRDAATGELATNSNEFDPVRMEGYQGVILYDYDSMYLRVLEKKSLVKGGNFAVGEMELKIVGNHKIFKFLSFASANQEVDVGLQLISEIELKKENENIFSYIGFLIWPKDDSIFERYCIHFPSNWAELKKFCSFYSIDLSTLETILIKFCRNSWATIIVAVKRPKKIIGYNGDQEFFTFSFYIKDEDIVNNNIVDGMIVKFQSHNQPFTTKKAKEISNLDTTFAERCMFFGCGALGAKVVMHFARSGVTDLFLLDPDNLTPHNLSRHVLFGNSVGLNKAEELEKEIKNLFPHELQNKPYAVPTKGERLLAIERFDDKNLDWIFDFSVSDLALQALCSSNKINNAKVCKGYISNVGKMGILLVEGGERNPRLDDLQISLYHKSKSEPSIKSWLAHEVQMRNIPQSITVGIGCNSETLILSDDIVSSHASAISIMLKRDVKIKQRREGTIMLNNIDFNEGFSCNSQIFLVEPFDVLKTVNKTNWEIRIAAGIINKLERELTDAYPNETGGIFIGSANYKTNTIHVVDIVTAPSDSKSTPVCFIRGTAGLSKVIEKIQKDSGKTIGYIGEWHTHPEGPECMSEMDRKAIEDFKNEFENLASPLPVFLMIITQSKKLPYVF